MKEFKESEADWTSRQGDDECGICGAGLSKSSRSVVIKDSGKLAIEQREALAG